MSNERQTPRPAAPAASLPPLAVTSHNPARAGSCLPRGPRQPALRPFSPQYGPTPLAAKSLLLIPTLAVPPHPRRHPSVSGTGSRCVWCCKVDTPSSQPQASRHPRPWPVLSLPLIQPPTPTPRPPPVLPSAGDELLRWCLIHRQLNQLGVWGGERWVSPLPPSSPLGVWAGGSGKARWVDSGRAVHAYPSLSPFPSQFHFHTYSHPPGTGGGWCSLSAGNWLSLWSPVYFPPLTPPSSSPPLPHAAWSSWETCSRTLQS